METIKTFFGKIEDSPVFLNNGKFGWYLNYNDKLYSVPEPFQSKKFDIKTAKKIIDWKDAHPPPTKPPTIAQVDAYEKAKTKYEKDNESDVSDEEIKKFLKFKKKGVI